MVKVVEWSECSCAFKSLPVATTEAVCLVRPVAAVGVVATLLLRASRPDTGLSEVSDEGEVSEVPDAVTVRTNTITAFGVTAWDCGAGARRLDGANVFRHPPSVFLHALEGRGGHRQ